MEITSNGSPLRLACWITSRTVLDASIHPFPLVNPNCSGLCMIPIALCILSANIFEYSLKYPSSIDSPQYESGSVQTLPGFSIKITVLWNRNGSRTGISSANRILLPRSTSILPSSAQARARLCWFYSQLLRPPVRPPARPSGIVLSGQNWTYLSKAKLLVLMFGL